MEVEELACQVVPTIASHAKSTGNFFVKMNGLILRLGFKNKAIFWRIGGRVKIKVLRFHFKD
jgi:hypothetical protein